MKFMKLVEGAFHFIILYKMTTHVSSSIHFAEYNKGRTPTGLETWCMGAVAGVCGQCSSYPLDIVRRRMQTAGIRNLVGSFYCKYRFFITLALPYFLG